MVTICKHIIIYPTALQRELDVTAWMINIIATARINTETIESK
jgi:hypothetical protein